MKNNFWLDKAKKRNKFNKKFLDEAIALEKKWMQTGMLDLIIRITNNTSGHWLDGQRLTNEPISTSLLHFPHSEQRTDLK